MANNLHHMSVQTGDAEELVWFLKEVAGFRTERRIDVSPAATDELLGWPEPTQTTATLHGEPPGMFEVIDIPPEQRDSVSPGVAMLTIAVRDLATAVERCRQRGLTITNPLDLREQVGLLAARLELGGLVFELVQYVE